MPARRKPRPLDAVLDDIEEAAGAAYELVQRGRAAWDGDRLLRLAGEAVIGRIADATNRLPDQVKRAVPDVPWDDIRDIRILVDHIYQRIDYQALWKTLEDDIPHLLQRLRAWRENNRTPEPGQDARRAT
jgi:uncharacterized protein with HEPN domain